MTELRFKVAPVWKGNYNENITYDISDEVSFTSDMVEEITENTPTFGHYRSLIKNNTSPLNDTSAWSLILDLSRIETATREGEETNEILKSNEAIRVNNENNRIEQENIRKNSEQQRVINENNRKSAETSRIDAETNRKSSENSRKDNETSRNSAENQRINAENTRILNESTRQSNETIRSNNETSRVSSENTRKTNENTRISNELTRQQNETTRLLQEGSSSDSPNPTGSRWARYKLAESDRDTIFNNSQQNRANTFTQSQTDRQTSYNQAEGTPQDTASASGSRWARFKKAEETRNALVEEKVADITRLQEEKADISALENGEVVPALAENLAPWADQKAIATPDTYSDAVRTTGGDIPIETSAGSKLENIKPVAGKKWTAKMLFNGSYNMLNAVKWGDDNSQPFVGGVGSDFVYFLVPELTLGTFGTADENNGLLFTDEDGVNVQPTSVYFKPLGSTVPQSLTDGTSITPTSVSYDGNTYKDYETSGAGWLIIPKTYYNNDICAHIAWEDWYNKHVSLDAPNTNPEAVVGILMLEGLLALAHSDKYLRGVNEEVCDNAVFGDTSATISHMVDELSVAAASWTNSTTGESDSQGNALYRHSATVSGIKQGGAACVEGEDGGIPLTVNGTTVSYVDTNAAAPASTVFYQIPTTEAVEKAYTDSVFSGSNIDTATGVLPINDCSIEAQVAMDGEANITVKYAKNIVDQVAINATVDVPQIKKQVEEHEERIEELENTAVRTGSYDASVAVGLADNFKGDTIVDAEFYKRKTGGQSVGSGIAAIEEMRGKSIVWNQRIGIINNVSRTFNGVTFTSEKETQAVLISGQSTQSSTFQYGLANMTNAFAIISPIVGHRYIYWAKGSDNVSFYYGYYGNFNGKRIYVASADRIQFSIAANADFTTPERVVLNAIDLTLMFGAGNEPSTVAEFEKMFPLDYYDYNEGEVIPFAGQNLVTTGFNQWDEQWESGAISSNDGSNSVDATKIRSKNYIPVFPNTEYYCVAPNNCYVNTRFYDADKQYIGVGGFSGGVSNITFTVPEDAYYLRIQITSYGTTYNNDICINISNPDRNGTYEPYEKHTLPLDPSQWRDKQGNLVFPYGGMHGVGNVYDYAKVDADGYIRKVVRCFNMLNLGDIFWTKGTSMFYSNVVGYKRNSTANMISGKYTYDTDISKDKVYFLGKPGHYDGRLNIVDSAYTDATNFKASVVGIQLIYELEEPVEIELATPVYAKYLVDKDGTEEITPANGSTPYTTMANLSILYAMDARGEIKNLPKNYISKESAENMLNAMVTAGIIASYTMTWDSANGRYAFVITAPEPTPEPEETND